MIFIPFFIFSSVVFVLLLFLLDFTNFVTEAFLSSKKLLDLLSILILVKHQLELHFVHSMIAHLKFFRIRPFKRRRENRVNANSKIILKVLEDVLYESWNDFWQQRATKLKARIRVTLNQVDVHAFIEHKIQTKELKVVLPPIRLDDWIRGSYRVSCKSLHFWQDFWEKVKICSIGLCEILLKLFIRNFVSFLVFAVVGWVFLDSVVGQMCIKIFTVLYVVFSRCSSDVTLLIPITFYWPVYAGHKHVVPNIKFPFLVQKWLLNVLLKNISPQTPIAIFLFRFQPNFYFV